MIFASVISVLKQRGDAEGAALNLWNARTMFDVANLLADAIRDIERRDGPYLAESDIRFNASFILGGQIIGEPMRLNQRPTARRLVVINAEVCRCEKSEDDSAIALAGGRGPDDISGRSTLNGEARINAAVRVSAMRPAARL
jgi:hypothetical protein